MVTVLSGSSTVSYLLELTSLQQLLQFGRKRNYTKSRHIIPLKNNSIIITIFQNSICYVSNIVIIIIVVSLFFSVKYLHISLLCMFTFVGYAYSYYFLSLTVSLRIIKMCFDIDSQLVMVYLLENEINCYYNDIQHGRDFNLNIIFYFSKYRLLFRCAYIVVFVVSVLFNNTNIIFYFLKFRLFKCTYIVVNILFLFSLFLVIFIHILIKHND